MRAWISGLTDRKYYGTEVNITDENDEFADGGISIWVMGNYKPSRRQIEVIKQPHNKQSF
jgi:hypothetical protein